MVNSLCSCLAVSFQKHIQLHTTENWTYDDLTKERLVGLFSHIKRSESWKSRAVPWCHWCNAFFYLCFTTCLRCGPSLHNLRHYDAGTDRRKQEGQGERHMPAGHGCHLRNFIESPMLRLLFISHCPKLQHLAIPNQQRSLGNVFFSWVLCYLEKSLDYDSNKRKTRIGLSTLSLPHWH